MGPHTLTQGRKMGEKERQEILCQLKRTSSQSWGGGTRGAEGVRGRWAVTRRGSRIGPLKGGGSRMSWRDKQVFSWNRWGLQRGCGGTGVVLQPRTGTAEDNQDIWCFPRWLSAKESTCQCRRQEFDPCVRRRKWPPPQYPWLENPMDRGAWRATIHRVTKSWTQLRDWAQEYLKMIWATLGELTREPLRSHTNRWLGMRRGKPKGACVSVSLGEKSRVS